jgi:hypothetical protein
MKVICKENKAKNLDFKQDQFTFSKETEFSIEHTKEYIVMGIMIEKESNCLYYLIDDDFGRPSWLPYVLFNISDNQLPPYWYVNILNKHESMGSIFYLSGFDELCNNDDYHDALLEYEKWALEIYFKRKQEIKEWHLDKW